jgi:phage/plasmid-associated DNA primase
VKTKTIIPDWASKLDVHPYLLCFENGVLDLKTGELRAGRKEDYITQSTGYDYFDEKTPYDASVMDDLRTRFIELIYPVAEEREYVQR